MEMMKPEPEILPVHRTKDQARTSYDRLSSWYDLLAGIAEKKYKLAGLVMLDPQPGDQILEIGFGTGQILLPLAQAVHPSGTVSGIDLSPGMLNVAEKKLTGANLQDSVTLTCGDAAQLPYLDASFDAVYSSFTLELFDTPEIAVVLAECRRVLKSGGRISVVSIAKRPNPNLITRLYEWSHRNFEAYADCRPIYPAKSLATAGFQVTAQHQMSMFGLPVDVVMGQLPD
jgi:demethylmenaquinone methyltransferase/2-methoxy-6-polyprenyl-1,4-benzoquinol methylase